MRNRLGKFVTRNLINRPIFVIGAGRSGTSILLQALGYHSKILSMEVESPFIPYVGTLVNPFEFRHNKQYHIESLQTPLDYTYEQFRKLAFECAIGKHYGLRKLASDPRRLQEAAFTKQHWCAKTYPNEYEARGLIKLFPEVKLIYVFRSGYEVVHSRSHKRGMREMDFRGHCEVWQSHVEKYQYLFDLDEATYVRHEDLVVDPDRVYRALLDHIGVAYEPGPMNFSTSTLVHSLDQRTKANVDALAALKNRPKPYESWTEEQRQVFNEVCGEGMKELGYDLVPVGAA